MPSFGQTFRQTRALLRGFSSSSGSKLARIGLGTTLVAYSFNSLRDDTVHAAEKTPQKPVDKNQWLRDLAQKSDSGKKTWLDDILSSPNIVSISSEGVLNLGSGITLGEDHFFSALMEEGLVNSIDCWYDRKEHLFVGVFNLGEDVCGYPRLVHGGLSAAVADETFGGLIFALKEYGVLPGGPAYTARLELDYARPVPANTKVVALARVEQLEGRKVWMACALTGVNGPGQGGKGTYVRARALFVHPKPRIDNPLSWLCMMPWSVSKALFVAANKLAGTKNPLEAVTGKGAAGPRRGAGEGVAERN